MANSSSADQEPETFKQFDIVQDFSDHKFKSISPSKPRDAKRIIKEWRILEKDLPKSIYVRVYEGRIDLLRALIMGSPGTPYHDGLFVFDFMFPVDYPGTPPKAKYHSFGYNINPNLYSNGRVCLSLLNTWDGGSTERWNPDLNGGSTMLQVLVSIQGLILNSKPYCNEPGREGETNMDQIRTYNEAVFLLSCRTIMCLLRNPPLSFERFIFDHFAKRGTSVLRAFNAYCSGEVEVGYYTDEGPLLPPGSIRVSDYLQGMGLALLYEGLRKEFVKDHEATENEEEVENGNLSCDIIMQGTWNCFCQCVHWAFCLKEKTNDDEALLLERQQPVN